jgi:hypothetical protein
LAGWLCYNTRMNEQLKTVPEADKPPVPPGQAAPGTPDATAAGETPQTSFTAMSEKVHKEKQRTPGLRMFDFLLYPVFTNVGVFGVSVAATYLTTRGGDRNASGQLIYGKAGQFFQQRGDWMINKFKSLGMTHSQADMGKMVFFSFLDGSLLAPFVKMFEDRRETIARSIDDRLGTTPEDLSVYAAEPKQTWLSVLGGRFATAAIVVPTAVALDKTGLNDRLFNRPGERMGEWLAKKPGVKKFFGSLDVKELSRIGFFEAFYTSVCTAGLYVSSRFLARRGENKREAQEEQNAAAEHAAKDHALLQARSAEHAPPAAAVAEEKNPARFSEKIRPHSRTAIEPRQQGNRKSAGSFREQYLNEMSHAPALIGA